MPFCQTISVVMSPKGLKAPPALAATTMLMQASATNSRLLVAHRHDHRAHQQGGGQVVSHRRDEEGQQAGHPEERPEAEPLADQPGAQGVEDQALVHGVDVGHGHQQEQHQLGVLEEVVPHRLLRGSACRPGRRRRGDQRPDDAGGEHHRLGLAQMGELLRHHQQVGGDEQDQVPHSRRDGWSGRSPVPPGLSRSRAAAPEFPRRGPLISRSFAFLSSQYGSANLGWGREARSRRPFEWASFQDLL